MSSSIFDRTLSVVLVVVAAAVGASVVHREFAAPPRAAAGGAEYEASWRELLPVGTHLGSPNAPVKLIEFSDLECPYCRALNQALHELAKERPGAVDVEFIHYPLQIHRFSNAAAQVAECARGAGRFSEMVDVLFAKQDSLGIKSWGSYAEEAGVADTARFVGCARNNQPPPSVADGRKWGEKFHVRGTPTVLVNGWRFASTPTKQDLLAAVDSARIGRLPDGKKLPSN